MSDRELLAIMSAIIFAGADSATENAGYFPPGAVAVAQEILACVDARGNKPEEAKAAEPAESTEPWIAEGSVYDAATGEQLHKDSDSSTYREPGAIVYLTQGRW